MTCADFEIVLADYLDGILSPGERSALERHASTCAGCGELLKDAKSAVTFLKRAADITPPAGLITRIAFQAPTGRTREPFERQGIFSKLASRWLQPILQPRLAMGMAMTILSFAMLERCTGVRVQHIQPADLNPVRIWGSMEDKTLRVKDRAVKYYENLRWVYEIESRLRSFEDQPQSSPSQPAPAKNSADRTGRHTNSNQQGAPAPHQGNNQ